MPLRVSSTCAHHQEVKIALHSLWYHHTYRCDDTRGCIMQFWPPDDEHMCSKHVEAWNKLTVKKKICASSWLITEKITTVLNTLRSLSCEMYVRYIIYVYTYRFFINRTYLNVADYLKKNVKNIHIVCRSLTKHTNGNMTGTEGGGYRGRW